MKELLLIAITILIIYFIQTTINNELRIVKLEQQITELQYRINEIKITEYRKIFWYNQIDNEDGME